MNARAGSVPVLESAATRRLLAFLRDPRSYPDEPRHLHLTETHASWLVLTPRLVYKVKKPVNFGFLDFSTLEKRRYFCEREVALNRRLCPGVHLGVLSIFSSQGRLSFGAGEKIVEYAVVMRHLPERCFLTHLLARGLVSKREMDRIVATLTPFYKEQAPIREISQWGRVAKLQVSTRENFRQTQDFIGKTISRPAFESIRQFTNAFYRRHAPLFATRVAEGHIRDCHGDLHLEHIHLTPLRLAIYDCIEFNDRFRYIDVASDVAFLAMDLDFRGRPDLARYLVTQLSEKLSDPDLLRLLDFYKCYRAYVRGKVESIQASVAGVPEAERGECRDRAERYFQFSLRYAIFGSAPTALIVMGRVGSGKSTLAPALGRELGWKVLSSDRLRKDLAGVPLYVRSAEADRRRLYAKEMTDRTYAALVSHALEEVRQYGGAVVDATFASRDRRARFLKMLERAGISVCFIETKAAPVVMKQRLIGRAHSEGEISDARLEDYAMLERSYEPPLEIEGGQYLAVKTAKPSEAVVAATLRMLAQRNAIR